MRWSEDFDELAENFELEVLSPRIFFELELCSEPLNFPLAFSAPPAFDLDFGIVETVTIRENADYYDGSYTVTPMVISQELQTRRKQMKENLKINEIPFFDVSNPAGGQTIYIGKEI